MATYTDLYIDAGADYYGSANLGDLLQQDHQFFGDVRRTLTSPVATSLNFSLINNQPNKVRLTLSSTETKDLKPGRYFYDIFARNRFSGNMIKVQEGQVHVSPAITTDISVAVE